MKLPDTHKELWKVFMDASAPDAAEFDGEYLVDMLTVWPSFRRFSHRKIIHRGDNRITGHNVLFNRTWGHFFIEEAGMDKKNDVKVVVLNYNTERNPFLLRGIRDFLRCIRKDELYIGRFNYMISGRLIFLGYFSLEKTRT